VSCGVEYRAQQEFAYHNGNSLIQSGKSLILEAFFMTSLACIVLRRRTEVILE
jgi:hypothetical protein